MRKIKLGIDPIGIIGAIFTTIGFCFLLVGIIITVLLFDSDTGIFIFTAVFCGIGGLFFVLGLVFLIRALRKRAQEKQLIANGIKILAQVTGVTINYSITINGRNPYVVEARYTDPITGIVHIFHSRSIYYDPYEYVNGRLVEVFCVPDNYDRYYMDVDAILPQVEMH